jgi:hypothetical protein
MNKKTKFYRFLEMIPGLLTWNIIFFLFWGSLLIPRVVAYFVIAFLIFWLYQSFKAAILGIRGYLKINQSKKINWQKKYHSEKEKDWLQWKEIKHVVIIPNYDESVKTISKNLQSLANQANIETKEKLIVVLAMEKRAKDHKERAEKLISLFKDNFYQLFATYHPPDIAGEIKGKASNEAWAAKETKKKLVNNQNFDINKLTLTTCDADAQFDSNYFSALTYKFCQSKNRYYQFWQGPIFWHNNLNQVPAPIRIVGIISNIIYLAHLQEPDGLFFNHSGYSLSFKLIHNVGYWDTNIIPEDWHIFLQAFFFTKGKSTVKPIFAPISIDAPEGKSYWMALKNRYLQCQRHAWGATDIPYAIQQTIVHKDIPLSVRLLRTYKLMQTHILWVTNWFILTLGATLPPLLNPKFFQTSLGYNLPKFSQIILTICLVALAITILLDWKLQPKKDKNLTLPRKALYLLQWILMPVATLFMSVLPGLDAQTKLLFGKRLEYWVTKKY